MRREQTLVALVAVVLLHFAITLAHGWAHAAANVRLGPAGITFVLVVIIAGPLAGVGWMRTNRAAGTRLIALTMTMALLFGLLNHFVITGVDRVDRVDVPSRAPFEATAVLLAITEAAAAAVAIQYTARRPGAYRDREG
jgi:hypothetical protein